MIWHYTVEHKAAAILIIGKLLPLTSYQDEVPSLWFSSNQTYEPTCMKAIQIGGRTVRSWNAGDLREYSELFRLWRFGVRREDITLLAWKAASKKVGYSARVRRGMELGGKAIGGHPKQWFATFDAVPVAQTKIQVMENMRWVDYNEELHGFPTSNIKSRSSKELSC